MAVLSSLRLASVALLALSGAEDVASQPMQEPLDAIVDRSAEEQILLDLQDELSAPRRLSAGVSVISFALGDMHCEEEFFAFDCKDARLPKAMGIGGTILDFLIAIFLMLYMFKGLAEICDSYFEPALQGISEALKLSPDVAGATFMAAGSSAPELFTSIVCTFFIPSNGGVGTIIGSAIFNIFVIVGATGVFACKQLKKERPDTNGVLHIWWYPLTRDTTFYIISIGLLFLVLRTEKDEKDGDKPKKNKAGRPYANIELWESCLMWGMYLVYIAFMIVNPKIVEMLGGAPGSDDVEEVGKDPEKGEEKENGEKNGESKENDENKLDVPGAAENGDKSPGGNHSPRTLDQHPVRFSGHNFSGSPKGSPRGSKDPSAVEENGEKKEEEAKEGGEEEEEDEEPSCLSKYDPMSIVWRKTMPGEEHYWILFILCVLYIMLLSYVMVDAVDRMGKIVGIPIFIMALLFLAAGTSIPDALSSIAVAKQGEGDMAVCNALGSNVFDILLGLGVPWTLGIVFGKPSDEYADGLKPPMDPIMFENAGLAMWILVLSVVVVVFYAVMIASRWKLTVKVGYVMLACYFVYVAYAIVNNDGKLDLFGDWW
jgi:K+-dependent Na+/Ca+ exchanger-like protein